ncbi:MAG: hypothetical protein AAF363_09710 [Bacteroidota bacterium]
MNGINLKSSHLIVSPSVSGPIFQDENSVYICYKKEQDVLLVSPSSNSWFPKLHESKEYLVKDKDLKGTKSIAIMDILIDHELDSEDRPLSFKLNDSKRYIKINFQG